MPERPDRLYWVHAKAVHEDSLPQLNRALSSFASQWGQTHRAMLDCTPCVIGAPISDRLWLFRLHLRKQGDSPTTEFNRDLKAHIKQLSQNVGAQLRRRSNLPTPLVREPLAEGNAKSDIGLHSVNDIYNQMLVTFSYHELPGREMPLHHQVPVLRSMVEALSQAWQEVACSCNDQSCEQCRGEGCYSCFSLGCADCAGTGWKKYTEWGKGGFRIDYSAGVPIAAF